MIYQVAEKPLDHPGVPLIRSDDGSIIGIEAPMRGEDTQNQTLFSYVRTDDRIPSNHPPRLIRQIADAALTALSGPFDAVYVAEGRPSIPPERLLRALLIQAFYSVRPERQLMEQLNYNLLFRWFVGLSVDDPVWDPSP